MMRLVNLKLHIDVVAELLVWLDEYEAACVATADYLEGGLCRDDIGVLDIETSEEAEWRSDFLKNVRRSILLQLERDELLELVVAIDKSLGSNGTFEKGSPPRLACPHRLGVPDPGGEVAAAGRAVAAVPGGMNHQREGGGEPRRLRPVTAGSHLGLSVAGSQLSAAGFRAWPVYTRDARFCSALIRLFL